MEYGTWPADLGGELLARERREPRLGRRERAPRALSVREPRAPPQRRAEHRLRERDRRRRRRVRVRGGVATAAAEERAL